MAKILYLGILGVMVFAYTSSFGQKLDTVEAICALNKTAPHTVAKFDVPFGAQHSKETVWRKTAPEDFHAVLALMQVVSVAPCDLQADQEAKLSIRAIRLIERDPKTGNESVVSEVRNFSDQQGEFRFDGELYSRIPTWYSGASSKPTTQLSKEDKVLTIDLGKSPKKIFHGWTDPKVATKPGMNYLVEMEVKISGSARLQMGIDYWREIESSYNEFDQSCEKSNNCEGSLSNWFGPTDGWQTIRAPKALAR